MNAKYEAIHENAIGYEGYMGRWSRKTGELFADWLQIPQQRKWLDVGCGTGALTDVILKRCDPQSVTAFDLSEPHVGFAQSHFNDPRANFSVGDAMAIDAAAGEFDVAVAGLMLNFILDRRKAIAEMSRVVQPGGVVAATVWDWAGGRNISQHLWEALLDTSPSPEFARQSALRIDGSRPEALVELLKSARLSNVNITALDFVAEFPSFDHYWLAHTGFSSSPGLYCRSLESDLLDAIQRRLKACLPADANGKISYPARAWALRGEVSHTRWRER